MYVVSANAFSFGIDFKLIRLRLLLVLFRAYVKTHRHQSSPIYLIKKS